MAQSTLSLSGLTMWSSALHNNYDVSPSLATRMHHPLCWHHKTPWSAQWEAGSRSGLTLGES